MINHHDTSRKVVCAIGLGDIANFRESLEHNLLAFPPGILKYSSTTCSHHHEALDSYSQQLVSTLCASRCIPMYKSTPGAVRNLTGWNHGANKLKEATRFWHNVWEEAGCPSLGVLFNIKTL